MRNLVAVRFTTGKLIPVLKSELYRVTLSNPSKTEFEINMLPVLRRACIFTLRQVILDEAFEHLSPLFNVKDYYYNRSKKVLYVSTL